MLAILTGVKEKYLTLTEAAERIGLKDASGLRHAVMRGILKAERIGPIHITTQEWLDEYVAHVEATKGGKGKKRGPRNTKIGDGGE